MNTEILALSSAKPAIQIGETDFERLSGLAEAVVRRLPDLAEELLVELDRADCVPADKLAPDVVRMGSTLTYTTDEHGPRHVTLVYPGDADIALGRISILTPIGVALIGLARGQSIEWLARDGQRRRLTVLSVDNDALSTESA